eukprot:370123_1
MKLEFYCCTMLSQNYSFMRIYKLILILVVSNVLPLISPADIVCNQASSCLGQTIVTTNGDDTFGNGYKSLYGPTTSITGTGNSACAFCSGSFSCDDIEFITVTDLIKCSGSNSCSNINGSRTLYISGSAACCIDNIQCSGSNSCKYSNLRGGGTVEEHVHVYCGGDRSCNNAYFEEIVVLAVRGVYGFFGGVFNSSRLAYNPKIYLEGYYAGFGGTIICYPETNCTIMCYGNGCYMLYLQCLGINNCIINKQSVDTIAPITNFSDLNTSILNTLSYNSEILTASNDAQCMGQNVFDDWAEIRNGADIIINGDNEGPICCRGEASCRNVTNIQFNTTPLDTTNYVVCSAENACQASGIYNINGAVFCDGYLSCTAANIIAKNIYCLGEYSCRYGTNIFNVENVYCSGYYGCAESKISSSGDINIYLLGGASGYNLEIYCNDNDRCFIICGGYNACSSTTFYCNGTCIAECVPNSGCPISLTVNPTAKPTINPTTTPTIIPSNAPSLTPSIAPTNAPSLTPSITPSISSDSPSLPPSISPTYAPSLTPSITPSIPTNVPTNIPSIVPSISPTNAPLNQSKILQNWIVKDGANCNDGYTDLNESNDHYGIYCMICPSNTAGTSGNCFECDTSKEPNHPRTECVDKQKDVPFYGTVEFEAIISVIGLLMGCGCVGGIYVYFKKKICPKTKGDTVLVQMQTSQKANP